MDIRYFVYGKFGDLNTDFGVMILSPSLTEAEASMYYNKTLRIKQLCDIPSDNNEKIEYIGRVENGDFFYVRFFPAANNFDDGGRKMVGFFHAFIFDADELEALRYHPWKCRDKFMQKFDDQEIVGWDGTVWLTREKRQATPEQRAITVEATTTPDRRPVGPEPNGLREDSSGAVQYMATTSPDTHLKELGDEVLVTMFTLGTVINFPMTDEAVTGLSGNVKFVFGRQPLTSNYQSHQWKSLPPTEISSYVTGLKRKDKPADSGNTGGAIGLVVRNVADSGNTGGATGLVVGTGLVTGGTGGTGPVIRQETGDISSDTAITGTRDPEKKKRTTRELLLRYGPVAAIAVLVIAGCLAVLPELKSLWKKKTVVKPVAELTKPAEQPAPSTTDSSSKAPEISLLRYQPKPASHNPEELAKQYKELESVCKQLQELATAYGVTIHKLQSTHPLETTGITEPQKGVIVVYAPKKGISKKEEPKKEEPKKGMSKKEEPKKEEPKKEEPKKEEPKKEEPKKDNARKSKEKEGKKNDASTENDD